MLLLIPAVLLLGLQGCGDDDQLKDERRFKELLMLQKKADLIQREAQMKEQFEMIAPAENQPKPVEVVVTLPVEPVQRGDSITAREVEIFKQSQELRNREHLSFCAAYILKDADWRVLFPKLLPELFAYLNSKYPVEDILADDVEKIQGQKKIQNADFLEFDSELYDKTTAKEMYEVVRDLYYDPESKQAKNDLRRILKQRGARQFLAAYLPAEIRNMLRLTPVGQLTAEDPWEVLEAILARNLDSHYVPLTGMGVESRLREIKEWRQQDKNDEAIADFEEALQVKEESEWKKAYKKHIFDLPFGLGRVTWLLYVAKSFLWETPKSTNTLVMQPLLIRYLIIVAGSVLIGFAVAYIAIESFRERIPEVLLWIAVGLLMLGYDIPFKIRFFFGDPRNQSLQGFVSVVTFAVFSHHGLMLLKTTTGSDERWDIVVQVLEYCFSAFSVGLLGLYYLYVATWIVGVSGVCSAHQIWRNIYSGVARDGGMWQGINMEYFQQCSRNIPLLTTVFSTVNPWNMVESDPDWMSVVWRWNQRILKSFKENSMFVNSFRVSVVFLWIRIHKGFGVIREYTHFLEIVWILLDVLHAVVKILVDSWKWILWDPIWYLFKILQFGKPNPAWKKLAKKDKKHNPKDFMKRVLPQERYIPVTNYLLNFAMLYYIPIVSMTGPVKQLCPWLRTREVCEKTFGPYDHVGFAWHWFIRSIIIPMVYIWSIVVEPNISHLLTDVIRVYVFALVVLALLDQITLSSEDWVLTYAILAIWGTIRPTWQYDPDERLAYDSEDSDEGPPSKVVKMLNKALEGKAALEEARTSWMYHFDVFDQYGEIKGPLNKQTFMPYVYMTLFTICAYIIWTSQLSEYVFDKYVVIPTFVLYAFAYHMRKRFSWIRALFLIMIDARKKGRNPLAVTELQHEMGLCVRHMGLDVSFIDDFDQKYADDKDCSKTQKSKIFTKECCKKHGFTWKIEEEESSYTAPTEYDDLSEIDPSP